ncbi:MAG: pyridoxal phosphate-dependent aminotransferase family protein [Candidatus Paceibacterota bacterium]|jgi:8-amino-7-oxononanoate synthase
MKKINEAVSKIRGMGLYPNPPVVNSPHAPELIVDGKKVLMFATNNYLGMTFDPRVVEAAVVGVRKWGIGNGSARLLTGNLDIHNTLEDKIAKFKNREAGLSFVSGYMANSGTIAAIAKVPDLSLSSLITHLIVKEKDTVIFSDQYNHASIIAGIKLSGCPKEIYKHLDMSDLENKLKSYPKSRRKIICADGVFSMDGDMSPVPDILVLGKKYDAMVYIDDAHGTGILGPHGRGIEDYFGVEGQVDVVMGTFTKCFGGVGGFVVGSQNLIDYLKITADSFIFTAPIAPPVVYGLIEAIDIVSKEPWRREKVMENAKYLKEKLSEAGMNYMGSKTQIIPIFIGDEKKAMRASELLLERGIFIPAARWPAVPNGAARLRTTVSSSHTKEQIDQLMNELIKVKKELKF